MCSWRAVFLSATMLIISSMPGLSAKSAPAKVRSSATNSVAPFPSRTATRTATAGVAAAASRLPALGPLLLLLVVGNGNHTLSCCITGGRTQA